VAEPGSLEESGDPSLPLATVPARRARGARAEVSVGRVLRFGVLISGSCFGASLLLEMLPVAQHISVAIDLLQKGAISFLLVTPAARLVVAGLSLGLRGEWKYALYAGGVLALLAVALGAGLAG
jgi:hypothetical protein